ncbi:MAG TPA: D-alanyl-D-alanine carboxypeptidase family protein [Blastocatellia bacterium]|nr:D-alanyl-D-alanine carboxypeptidase family protein [Blastocatellia bacterium]
MTSNKGFILGLAVVIIAILFIIGTKTDTLGGAAKIQQAQASARPAADSAAATEAAKLSTTNLSAPAKAESVKSSANSALSSAALKNMELQSSLAWAFGGKSQRGWQLYTYLIASMVASEHDSNTNDFAEAISRWQRERGLVSSGIIDNSTWSQMVSTWQSDRLKDKSRPSPDQLVTASVSDLYDPGRPEELRKVERQTYLAYKRMVAAAAADPSLKLAVGADGELAPGEKFLKIVSAHRSPEYQSMLRKQSPNSGRAGLAVNSPHFTGKALDIYVGGEPVSTKDANRAIQVQTPVYRWLVKNAAKFGFRPYFYEPWHWEYVGTK